MNPSVQLLEREQQAALLAGLIDSALRGAGHVALVHGEAGVGKTALLREVAGAVANIRIARGACEALLSPHPLGPLHDMARDAPALRDLLADGLRGPALFNAFLDWAAQSPTLLVIEDVHWADAATLDLIRYVGRRIEGAPVLMILTLRDEDTEQAALFRQTVADFGPERMTRIALTRLSREAVGEWLKASDRSPEEVYAATGGNPFFVSQVLASEPGAVPASIRDSMLGRIARLPMPAQDAMNVAALVPAATESWLLRAMLPAAETAVQPCIAAGLLVEEGESLRFRHELARLAVAESIPRIQARVLHERLLAALTHPPFGIATVAQARLLHHACGAGNVDAVLHWSTHAACEAVQRGARREAAANYRIALEHASRLTPAEHARCLMGFADQAFDLNQLEDAVAAYGKARECFEAGADIAATATALARLALPLVRLLRNAEADAASQEALRLAQSIAPSPALAEAHATEAYLRMLNRDGDDAQRHATKAIEWARRLKLVEVESRAWCALGAGLLFSDYPAAVEALHTSRQLAESLSCGEVGVAEAYLMLGSGSGEVFEMDTALKYLEEGIAFAAAHDLDRQGGYMRAWLSLAQAHAGQWNEAVANADACLRTEPPRSTSRVMALVAKARVMLRRGEPGASDLLDEALALAQASGTLQRLAPVRFARAEQAWLAGDSDAARAEIDAIMPLALAKRHAWFIGEGAVWAWRLGAKDIEAPSGCAEPFAMILRGEIDAAAEAWESRSAPVEAAQALECGDDEDRLRALAIWDELGASARAERLRASLKAAGVKVPAAPRAARPAWTHPAGLTRREHEVLIQLARGLQNRQIAEKLCRSVRTVDHHVAAVIEKLGATTRAEAVVMARDRGWLLENAPD